MVEWPFRAWAAALCCAATLAVATAGGAIVASSTGALNVVTPVRADDASTAASPESAAEAPGPLTRHTRLAPRKIYRFRSYKDVSMLPFHVPDRVRFASFSISVTETVMSSLVWNCPPRNVTVVLKFGSYPVVNPDGARFPDRYDIRRLPYYELEFLSDGKPRTINVSNPLPGDWYAVAYLSYTDPKDHKILQQGFWGSCIAVLEAMMDIMEQEETTSLVDGEAMQVRAEGVDAASLRRNFRVYVPETTRVARVQVNVTACSRSRCPALAMSARSNAFPGSTEADGGNETVHGSCSSETIQRGDDCALSLAPEEDAWLFLTVDVTPDAKAETQVEYSVRVMFEMDSSTARECSGENWTRVLLARQTYEELFMYNYVRVPDPAVSSNPMHVQMVIISTAAPTLLEFPVLPVRDVGGTLSLVLRLDKTEALLNATAPLNMTVPVAAAGTDSAVTPVPAAARKSFNVSVMACLSISSKRVPKFPDACVDATTGASTSASIRVNTTSAASYTGKLHVPFPEPGRWYLSLRSFCFTSGNDSEAVADCGDLNETQVSFVLDSEMCGAESCGQRGHCNNYVSGGVVFAACVCEHGYRGWGCTDDRRIDKLRDLLLAALLLTLSNLPFLPAAIVAARRGYYTEAFVYCCTMFFSTFYHACEAGEDVYSYCLMKLHVLQFCDFYSAILALWVTMIAMADLPPTPRSLFHMAGAVGIALGTEYDRTSLSVFMIPTLVGVGLVGIRWGMRCHAQRSCYPHKNYWKFCVVPCVMLVLVGIVCFSFLQTRSNYKYVHSAWHSMIAIAIIFVLPSRTHSSFQPVESDHSLDSQTSFWKRSIFWPIKCRPCKRWL